MDEVLIDHAHCEKKAAGTALNLIFHYVEDIELCREMTQIVNEELEHFHMVIELLERRGIRFRRLRPSQYGNKLHALVRKTEPELYCDLSSVAKGYAVDRTAERLDELGLASYMVEVGGEVRTKGTNARGAPWQMAVRKPVAGKIAVWRVIPLSGKAMATSGDYQNFYEVDGRRISHIIDPRTGRPIDAALASVTVVHDSCMAADAWATALTVLGPEEGLRLAQLRGLAVVFIMRDEAAGGFSEFMTTAFERAFPASVPGGTERR